MSGSQHEEANWDDIDWGILGPAAEESAAASAPQTPQGLQASPSAVASEDDEQSPPPPAPEAPGKSDPPHGAHPTESLASAPAPLGSFPEEIHSNSAPRESPKNIPREIEKPPGNDLEQPFVFAPTGAARLVLKSEGHHEVMVPIRDKLSVGRNADNDLVIRDLYVSGRHAQLSRRSEGLFEIEDLNSTGGTFLNEQLVRRRFLKDGDVLRFATVEARFHYTAGAQLEANASMGATLPPPTKEGQKVTFDPTRLKRSVLVLPDGTRFFLPATGEVTVGRLPTNEVMLGDPRVSGNHARILCSGGMHFEVFDLNSTWGTFVNRTKVTNHVLADGDILTLGVVDCLLEL